MEKLHMKAVSERKTHTDGRGSYSYNLWTLYNQVNRFFLGKIAVSQLNNDTERKMQCQFSEIARKPRITHSNLLIRTCKKAELNHKWTPIKKKQLGLRAVLWKGMMKTHFFVSMA